jgi:hypothetical protein
MIGVSEALSGSERSSSSPEFPHESGRTRQLNLARALRRTAQRMLTARATPWLLGFVAALSSTRVEQFTGNQETYLARAVALARANGVLDADWFVRTADPVPVFTRLAAPLVLLGPWAISFANAVFGAILLVALGNLARLGERRKSGREPSSLVAWVSAFALLWSAVPNSVRSVVFEGVADQRAYSVYLQPSNAGVLLVAAVWLALEGRCTLAVLLSAAAAWVHPTYALSSVLFSGGVGLVRARFGEGPRRGVLTALVGLVAVLPPTLLSVHTFAPSTWALALRASRVLVTERMSHHALIASWASLKALLCLGLIAAALLVTRGRQRALLAAWALLTLAVTALVLALGQPELLLLFPWRTTIWLVPASAALLFGQAFARVSKERSKWLLACVCPLVLSCSYGFARGRLRGAPEDRQGVALARKIPLSERQRWTLLVPVAWEGVRLNAPAAVYVDFKSHPYKDREVLEWRDRLLRAESVYAQNGPADCRALHALLQGEPRVGFVLGAPLTDFTACSGVSLAARDADGSLYRVSGRTSTE